MRSFSWVIDRQLAGMACPGLGVPGDPDRALQADLRFLVSQSVGGIVSLTAWPLDAEAVEALGFQYLHLPIPDMTPPSDSDVDRFVSFVDRCRTERRPVAVHCAKGQGRTGTLLACYLVSLGRGAGEAIDEVRERRPGSVETPEQERAVRRYYVRKHSRGALGVRLCDPEDRSRFEGQAGRSEETTG